MPTWPAIIKYKGEHELTLISNQDELNSDADLHFFGYEAEDNLIDSEGTLFSLSNQKGNVVALEPSGQKIKLADLLELIKAHESQQGSCCASKLSFQSIAEAVKAMGPTPASPTKDSPLHPQPTPTPHQPK